MANKSLTDLTARTATADSDLIHVNSGGTDYKETKANFSANLAKWVDFGNSSSLTTQIDALAGDCAYEGIILSYGHQSETGVPINANFYVDVIKIASGAGRVKIYALNSSAKPVSYINFKSGGTWQGWVQDPTRDEITALNSSLTNSSVSISPVSGNSGITVVANSSFQMNGIVFINLRFSLSEQKTAGSNLFNVPTPKTTMTGGSGVIACATNNGNVIIAASGVIANSSALAAGTYIVSCVYEKA